MSRGLLQDDAGHLPSKADSTSIASTVAQDAAGANLVGMEDSSEFLMMLGKASCKEVMSHMLGHVLWQIGDIQIGVAVVVQLLELRIERLLRVVSVSVGCDMWGGRTLAKLVS
ncbi:hypothetical protein MRB53_038949 [Persea americana]|nr:hypothetical protein MRB53_038949 [Persea americana]